MTTLRPHSGGKRPNQRGETRGGRPKPIQDVLGAILQARGLNTLTRDDRIFEGWSRVASEELRGTARPVRFRDGELLVEVASSTHLHELRTFTGEELRQRLNSVLGRELVRTIVFMLRTR